MLTGERHELALHPYEGSHCVVPRQLAADIRLILEALEASEKRRDTLAEMLAESVNAHATDAQKWGSEVSRLREDAGRLERERDDAETAMAEIGARGEWWQDQARNVHYVKVTLSDEVMEYAKDRRVPIRLALERIYTDFDAKLRAARHTDTPRAEP